MKSSAESMDPVLARMASEWFARLSDPSATEDDHRDWLQWRNASPAHEHAWQQVENVVRRFHQLDRSAAKGALSRPAIPARRQALRSLAAVGVMIGSGWLAYRQLPWDVWSADYQSATGELREVTLADGTQLILNTATAVNVVFDAKMRRVELVRGELHIATASDPHSRPLVVSTPFANLLPVGTRFSVRQEQEWVRLTVHEGAVDVEHLNGYGPPMRRIAAGSSVQITREGLAEPKASPANAEAWTQGMLLADGMALGDVVNELSRHRVGRLVCDPAVAELKLSGAFPLRNTDAALSAVARALPVRIVTMTGLWARVEPL